MSAPAEAVCGGGRGFDSPLSPFCVFPFSFLLLFFPSLLFLSFASPRFPLVPVLCFFWFFVCVFGGGCGVVWCVVWVWFWFGLGVMVFDVGVVWMGGSVLGPVWVRVCVWLFALLCVSLVCFGGEF